MNDRLRQRLIRLTLWLLVLLSCGLIFFFSSQPGPQSASTSARVTEAVARLTVKDFARLPLTAQQETIRALQLPVRKIAHALEFALLGFFLLLAWSRYPIALPKHLLLSLCFAAAVALLDERFQRSVPGRGSSWGDVEIDILGAACGILLCLAALRIWQGRKRRRKSTS